MPFNKTKSTKRFSFGITRNSTSHKAGANVVTIATNPEESSKYSTGTTQISMTVKEARVLQTFLNDAFSSEDSSVG